MCNSFEVNVNLEIKIKFKSTLSTAGVVKNMDVHPTMRRNTKLFSQKKLWVKGGNVFVTQLFAARFTGV